MSSIGHFIVSHLWMLPWFLVYLFGFVFAIANWSHCPSAAGLVTLAIVILLGTLVGGEIVNVLMYDMRLVPRDFDMGIISRVISILRNIVEAVATGILIAAAFSARGVAQRTSAGDIPTQYPRP